MATVSAPTNIACIKYWGKASTALNTPINSSISITLSQCDLRAVTTASASTSFTKDRLWLNGAEEDISGSRRFRACLDGVRALASNKIDSETGETVVRKEEWSSMHVHVSSFNTFPTAAGLASSAAGYAALVSALVNLFDAKERYEGELSAIARQGSGSACRSMHGGFVAWRMGQKADGSDSIADQVADENYWPNIRVLILVVSDKKKGTSSTAGMNTSVATSQLLSHRATKIVPESMKMIEEAFLARNFQKFGRITMEDSNQFHATCLDTFPPIFYMNDVSRIIIRVVHAYNDWSGEIRAAYTFDAGPNAVIYTLDKYAVEICALMLMFYPGDADDYFNMQDMKEKIKAFCLDDSLVAAVRKTCMVSSIGDVKMIYYTKSGPGPQILDPALALIDPVTGLNIRKP